MKATIQNVRAIAASHGATVEKSDGGRVVSLAVDLPAGKVWAATGGHTLGTSGFHRLGPECYADLIERMGLGVDACTDGECDICNGY